jgi:hypothetical protein
MTDDIIAKDGKIFPDNFIAHDDVITNYERHDVVKANSMFIFILFSSSIVTVL